MNRLIFNALVVLSLVGISHFSAYAQWSQTPGPLGGTVFFMESYAGAYWAGSESGLYRSVDGQSWSRVEHLGREMIIAGLADQDTFYLVRGTVRSDLLTTTDGGQTWKVTEISDVPPLTNVTLKKIAGALIIARITSQAWYLRSKDTVQPSVSCPTAAPFCPIILMRMED